jgi:hypothetical protein
MRTTKMPLRARKRRSSKPSTTAFHAQLPNSSVNVVGFGNLRVFVVEDEGMWFAECQDINYAAQGRLLDEVRRNFERGLSATVDEHLRVFGHIENLLARPPSLIVRRQIHKAPQRFRYSQVTVHRLPKKIQSIIQFQAIEFIQPSLAA